MAERTILVVEDDPVTRRAVSEALRKSGYAVVTADDGEQALAALGQGGIDLVLLDMLMPVLDGWGFLKRLRGAGSRVPVAVTSSIDLSQEWADSYGCCCFLKKPVGSDALLEAVRRCLGGAPLALPGHP